MIQMILFFTLAWKHGGGSDYLVHSLFSDLIFSWGQEHGGSDIWAGMWGWEQFFSDYLFSKNVFHRMIQSVSFSHWYGNVERGVIIWFVLCFSTTYFC